MAQESQTGALYHPRGVCCGEKWEGTSRGRGYIYTYGWFMLRFDRKQQNSVKQLSLKKLIKKEKKKPVKESPVFDNNRILTTDITVNGIIKLLWTILRE